MGPNSGGGRRNQGASNVPTRAIFSNKGLASGKGKDGKGKEKGKREPRQNFQSQKEMDKAKGKGKTSSNLSPAEAHIAAAAARASGGIQQEAISIWERGVDPSYIHGCFYLTRDDHLALEPLLTPLAEAVEETVEQLSSDTVETAQDHLKELGFQSSQSNTALGVVGPRLSKECRERDLSVTDKAAAERALEYMCCTSAEGELPSKLREPREVTAARKLQEERNVSFQTKALLQGGQIEGTFITRIEKLGFSRARAIQALAEAPDHQLLPAVKSLLSEFLPLDLPPGVDADSVVPASAEELNDEIEAMRSIYGDDEVQTFGQAGLDGFELLVKLPAVSGGGRWTMAFMIPGGLLYPHVSPLLCPRHERLREANRPRLMEALGEICQQALGSPMIFILCEWLQENGPRFLVRGEVEKQETPDSEAVRISQRDNAVNRAMEESQAKAQQDEEAASERSKRCEYLQQLMAEDSHQHIHLRTWQINLVWSLVIQANNGSGMRHTEISSRTCIVLHIQICRMAGRLMSGVISLRAMAVTAHPSASISFIATLLSTGRWRCFALTRAVMRCLPSNPTWMGCHGIQSTPVAQERTQPKVLFHTTVLQQC